MPSGAVVFGGSGYIGTFLVERLVEDGRYDEILVADTRPAQQLRSSKVRYVACDVTRPIAPQIGEVAGAAIFNLAAVHREPGHAPEEYYRTNVPGAKNVCEYAEQVGSPVLVFTSSISVYGKTLGPTDEHGALRPVTAYGNSKLAAEQIHIEWQTKMRERKLIIVRPGVIYGPGDPGNILRMIRAVRRGLFFLPGDGSIRKSYGYIYGLIDSIGFALKQTEPQLIYNYVERNTETLNELVNSIRRRFPTRWPSPPQLPLFALVAAASLLQLITLGRTGFHPMRVIKAARSTHIVPAKLKELHFPFRYDFDASLAHWQQIAPDDFA